ncbi:hypothetical protein A2U01_0082138 [Trifolium medium]|uniref:Uncharacterized protein n=1 Tax=Trifolium medium TaxID=97028 RepID=A0A392TIU8_9FABA|nr:hypothetical protein [Trifolium medium]
MWIADASNILDHRGHILELVGRFALEKGKELKLCWSLRTNSDDPEHSL